MIKLQKTEFINKSKRDWLKMKNSYIEDLAVPLCPVCEPVVEPAPKKPVKTVQKTVYLYNNFVINQATKKRPTASISLEDLMS